MSASKAMESKKIMSDEENKGVFLYVFTQILTQVIQSAYGKNMYNTFLILIYETKEEVCKWNFL